MDLRQVGGDFLFKNQKALDYIAYEISTKYLGLKYRLYKYKRNREIKQIGFLRLNETNWL